MKAKDSFYVFTNLAVSIDGKISTRDRAHIDPSSHDRYQMDSNRARAHAVLIGATTLRTFRRPAVVERKRFRLLRRSRRLNPHPINIVIARNIDFDPAWPFFADHTIERVIVVPNSTPAESLRPFQSLAKIFKYDEDQPVPEQIIAYLKKLGCRNLLIEGGGNIMFPWVEHDLIDEWNITLVPAIIGGENAPTMVAGEGFEVSNIKRYRLRHARRHKGELFIRYVRN